ncbi:uncharacterized protein LOC124839708 [Vigna umbellata]|uniref:uncharacterized protein LOC124839708 n=1 Tax=Vigna umbellata TaxID=87088 RepID=UPI001F5E4138|nr:uncharacterized protein LOC124839708 [Vigna umbellata]
MAKKLEDMSDKSFRANNEVNTKEECKAIVSADVERVDEKKERVEIGDLEVKPTKVTLLKADGSSKKPYGVAEDVVVCIDKLKFLVDFVLMDMKEDEKVPIILGIPFMKTAKVIINVDDGMIGFKTGEKR